MGQNCRGNTCYRLQSAHSSNRQKWPRLEKKAQWQRTMLGCCRWRKQSTSRQVRLASSRFWKGSVKHLRAQHLAVRRSVTCTTWEQAPAPSRLPTMNLLSSSGYLPGYITAGLNIMEIENIRQLIKARASREFLVKQTSLAGLLKRSSEETVCDLLRVQSRLAQQELLGALLNLQLIHSRKRPSDQFSKKKIVFEGRVELDSFQLSELQNDKLQDLLCCLQVRRQEKTDRPSLRVRPNKLRHFVKKVKDFVPNFCDGLVPVLPQGQLDRLLMEVIVTPNTKGASIEDKIVSKIERVSTVVVLAMESALAAHFAREETPPAPLLPQQPLKRSRKIEVPALGLWMQQFEYRNCGEDCPTCSSSSQQDRFSQFFGGGEFDLLSDGVENLMINKALNLIYQPRRRYSQEWRQQRFDALSVAMVKSGKDGVSPKFVQLLSKF